MGLFDSNDTSFYLETSKNKRFINHAIIITNLIKQVRKKKREDVIVATASIVGT